MKMKTNNGGVSADLIAFIVICLIVVAFIIAYIFGASGRRDMKSLVSNFSNGIDRTITLYDYNGNEIKSWSGKFDVSDSEMEVYFDDANGKRVIIHGGIVVNEEN